MRDSLLKDRVFLDLANKLGELSTCDRKSVGAIITKDGRCVSWGYNGAPPGLPHCDENNHGYMEDEHRWFTEPDGPTVSQVMERTESQLERFGCRNSTHAEANAVAFAARQGISTDGGTLYVTVFPCDVCARLLLAAGIVRVVFAEAYRNDDGYELLRKGGIQTEHLSNEVLDSSLQG